jgi:ethanolamine utilization protein EutP (predicted NTPase)
MFVVLACAQDKAIVHEIIGVVNKKKDLKALLESDVLHKNLLEDRGVEDIFDYSADDDELVAEVAGELPKKNGASAAVADEIDIDAI